MPFENDSVLKFGLDDKLEDITDGNSEIYSHESDLDDTQAMYLFDPHKHVKIWLSTNPNSFLNIINQNRLIRLRVLNPEIVINFVYDSRLLNEFAIENLKKFCKEYNINPVDVVSINRENLTKYEQKLFEYYDREINFAENGNPAAASDLLRFTSPVFSLGTYTDFDVEVNTSGMDTVAITTPILFSIGSIKLFDHIDEVEEIAFNTDMIAVVDIEDSKPMIEKIQRELIRACAESDDYKNTYLYDLYNKRLPGNLKDCLDKAQLPVKSNKVFQPKLIGMRRYRPNVSVPELRGIIKRVTADTKSFAEYILTIYKQYNPGESEKIKKLKAANLFSSKKVISKLNAAEQLLENKRLQYRFEMLKESVVLTTGPMPVSAAIFDMYVTTDYLNKAIKPYSFASYAELKDKFSSNNIPSFHITPTQNKERTKLIYEGIIQANDISWMEYGERNIAKKEQKMTSAALKIQENLRLHNFLSQLRNKILEDFENTTPLHELKEFLQENLLGKTKINKQQLIKFGKLKSNTKHLLSPSEINYIDGIYDNLRSETFLRYSKFQRAQEFSYVKRIHELSAQIDEKIKEVKNNKDIKILQKLNKFMKSVLAEKRDINPEDLVKFAKLKSRVTHLLSNTELVRLNKIQEYAYKLVDKNLLSEKATKIQSSYKMFAAQKSAYEMRIEKFISQIDDKIKEISEESDSFAEITALNELKDFMQDNLIENRQQSDHNVIEQFSELKAKVEHLLTNDELVRVNKIQEYLQLQKHSPKV